MPATATATTTFTTFSSTNTAVVLHSTVSVTATDLHNHHPLRIRPGQHCYSPAGTLIAPDMIATAGHCVDTSDCSQTSVVFNAINTNVINGATIPTDMVFSCASVVDGVRACKRA